MENDRTQGEDAASAQASVSISYSFSACLRRINSDTQISTRYIRNATRRRRRTYLAVVLGGELRLDLGHPDFDVFDVTEKGLPLTRLFQLQTCRGSEGEVREGESWLRKKRIGRRGMKESWWKWPLRSPDLTPFNLFPWEHVKVLVYSIKITD